MRVHALCNGAKSVRAVPGHVHAGDHREQHLRGADVGGGLLAANVLFARLQGQAVRGVAVRVHRDANKSTWE